MKNSKLVYFHESGDSQGGQNNNGTEELATDTLIPGEWYDVTVIRNGTMYTTYINGSMRGAVDSNDLPTDGDSAKLRFGGNLHGEHLSGSLSNVRIWNKALSESEIGATLDGNEAGLVGWFPFGGSGQTIVNQATGSDAGANGTPGASDSAASDDPTRGNSLLELYPSMRGGQPIGMARLKELNLNGTSGVSAIGPTIAGLENLTNLNRVARFGVFT